MKVSNMMSERGNTIPNQFIIHHEGCNFFQSYQSIIVKIDKAGQVTLDEKTWDYSVTTGRYRNQFLGEVIAETRKKIESGEYALADLNASEDALTGGVIVRN